MHQNGCISEAIRKDKYTENFNIIKKDRRNDGLQPLAKDIFFASCHIAEECMYICMKAEVCLAGKIDLQIRVLLRN